MEFNKIELSDREIIRNILARHSPQTSELTFANLFIWRHHYGFQWAIIDGFLIILCRNNAADCFAFSPIGEGSKGEISKKILRFVPKISRASEQFASELNDAQFQITAERKHFDYVYKTSDLIELDGGEYKQKRNHINKFFREFKGEYREIDSSNIEECIELANKWCERQEGKNMDVSGEWMAVNEALKNFETLKLKGGVITINDKVEAFSTGELLNDNTAVIHIEKANTEINGLYPLINQQFAQNTWASTDYINREQDLGLAGLRKAKLSYNPDHLVKKFSVRLI